MSQIGGWLRLWVLVTLLGGVGVAFVAYQMRPKVEAVQASWVEEGLDIVANHLNATEGSDLTPADIATHEGFDTTAEALRFFERVERSPGAELSEFEIAITIVNRHHRARIQEIERGSPTYILKALGVWLGAALALLCLGFAVRWVARGFAGAARH